MCPVDMFDAMIGRGKQGLYLGVMTFCFVLFCFVSLFVFNWNILLHSA